MSHAHGTKWILKFYSFCQDFYVTDVVHNICKCMHAAFALTVNSVDSLHSKKRSLVKANKICVNKKNNC